MLERKSRGIFSGVLVISVLVALSAFLLGYSLDQRCRTRFETALPVYPEAQRLSYNHEPIVYARAEYESADAPAEVEAWYVRTVAAQRRDAALGVDPLQGWDGQWEVSPGNDGGSLIVLVMYC